jgi:exo-1,4-beta-D-glucosaminidase
MMKPIIQILILLTSIGLAGCMSKQEPIGTKQLRKNWKIQQTSKIQADGSQISTPKFDASNWIDGYVPSTVMGILSAQPEYADLFVADNYYKADRSKFDESWWYRTEFTLGNLTNNKHVVLNFDGISYRANIWMNGQQIAAQDQVVGSFRRFEFDVTNYAKAGKNVLAVEIIRQREGDFGLGFVDWNPRPLDENLGIWRDVTVSVLQAVQLKHAFVRSRVNTQTLDEAWLTVGAELKNLDSEPVSGKLIFTLDGETVSKEIQLNANEIQEVKLDPNELDGLHIKNPKLWWSNGLGEPNLHTGVLTFEANGKIVATDSIKFGIREIEDYFTPQGVRGFKLNGQEILIKGAGWTDDIFLRDTPETNKIQVQYIKDMGLNTIRFETVWGTDRNIYDLCDQYGILAMVGWSCQWEWENYLGKTCDDFGGASTPEDFKLLTDYLHDQITWLRNHPSIFVWLLGSDMLPRPELEQQYKAIFDRLDNRPWLGAASDRTSELSGRTGVKMHGPYEYVGPSYWYIDKKHGGAYGFNTETGPGPQIPVKESITKMIPSDKLWPLNEAWNKHCTTSSSAMNSLSLHQTIVSEMWGTPSNLDDFLWKSYLVNYEAMRAMFEAFRANRPQSTGLIQWMLNSAWPSFYWQLYDFELIPTSAYYAVKKALQPVQLVYNYGDRMVAISNETLQNLSDATAHLKLYSTDSKLIWEQKIPIEMKANSSKPLVATPKFKGNAFLSLELIDANGSQLSDNFYWLSDKAEVYDWAATNWVHTTMKSYPDFKLLNSMKPMELGLTATVSESTVHVKIENKTDTISLFNQLKLHDGSGNWIVAALYSDNYFSILPGETTTIQIEVNSKANSLQLELSGWNTKTQKLSL